MGKKKHIDNAGFTLLELLIVIGIIAILSVILIIVINPAETLKKSRDVQRMSDFNTLKTALGIYMTSTSTPALGTVGGVDRCKTGSGSGSYGANSRVFYSVPTATVTITSTTIDGSTQAQQVATQATAQLVNGNGWIPVNFNSLTGGAPIASLPIDPVNTVASAAAPSSTDLVYRYVCNSTANTYELSSVLESTTYASKMANDGGNNSNYYEVGTDMTLLGTGTNY